jgi:EAL domain-containing protein (putative c-di-GMP-specific phosphodiesterase class I)
MKQLTAEQPRFVVGYARVLANPMARSERLILKVIADARASAELIRQRNALRDKATLQDVILRHQLNAVYQPIVQLESGDIFGFEALTRGPGGSALESPIALFAIADEVDLTFELDRACFRGGLRGAAGLSPVHRLFVNLLPQSFYDTRFIESEVERLLDGAGLTPANVVFEITERLAIENFTAFRQALATYTAMGFGVAIDDVGTRHSNLETVMALRPHFIKVSDILTRGVARSTVKREMMRSLQRIAAAIDAVIVAEGIEHLEDVEVLGDLGIRYGQGFYLARPGPAFPDLPLERQREIRSIADARRSAGRARLRVEGGDGFDQGDTNTFIALGRGSGEHPIFDEHFDELEPGPAGTMPGLEPDDGRKAGEDTRPNIILPAQEPWRPVSAEELGRPKSGSSLLDALRGEPEAKKSLN